MYFKERIRAKHQGLALCFLLGSAVPIEPDSVIAAAALQFFFCSPSISVNDVQDRKYLLKSARHCALSVAGDCVPYNIIQAKRGCLRFIPAKPLLSLITLLLWRGYFPSPSFFFFLSVTAQSVIACSDCWFGFFFFSGVFSYDTMQGISGSRKVRLEGGETLQSSLATMR